MFRLFSALTHKLNNIRLKNKLIISFVLVVFVPVLIVGIYLTAAFRQNVLDQATEQITSNVERIKKQTADMIKMPIEISDKLLVDNNLTNVINTQYQTTFDVVQAFWNYTDFKDYMDFYNEIYSIRFYTTNQSILENWEFLKVTKEIEEADWYRRAMDVDGIHWTYMEDETNNNVKVLSLVRKINFPVYRTSGVLVIAINQQDLDTMLDQETFETMIVDQLGFIIASKNREWIGRSLSELESGNKLANIYEGTHELEFEGEPSKIVVENLLPPSSRNGLRIISVFPIESIVSGANQISMLGLGIMLLSLLIALIMIYTLSAILAKRMLRLNKDLNKVAMGDLTVISDISGNDEIGVLSKQFNNMVVSIRGLMDEVTESQQQQVQLQLRQREIKLKMMASQINPHFLFNALESIRMQAHMKGEKELATIVSKLGKMIRRSLEVGMRNIPLKTELEMVRCYLEIQSFRYGAERLTFELDVNEAAISTELPPLIIQPLIENAVVHGLENVAEGGFVRLSIRVEAERMKVEVYDNGVGIEEGRMKEISESLHDMDEGEEYRIGLRNVHQRLIMLFGEDSGLQIASSSGEGTRISFEIPMGGHFHE
jgi:two-component system sensor histidine kinase YesM